MKNYRFFALSVLLFNGCSMRSSEVEIQNKSIYTASNFNVLVGGNSLSVDKILPDEKATITFEPKQDSSLKIYFESAQDSKFHSCFFDVYVTHSIRYEFVVVINADGECKLVSSDESNW